MEINAVHQGESVLLVHDPVMGEVRMLDDRRRSIHVGLRPPMTREARVIRWSGEPFFLPDDADLGEVDALVAAVNAGAAELPPGSSRTDARLHEVSAQAPPSDDRADWSSEERVLSGFMWGAIVFVVVMQVAALAASYRHGMDHMYEGTILDTRKNDGGSNLAGPMEVFVLFGVVVAVMLGQARRSMGRQRRKQSSRPPSDHQPS